MAWPVEAATQFPPCAVAFADDFCRYTENLLSGHYAAQLGMNLDAIATEKTAFDRIDELATGGGAIMWFNEKGVTIIKGDVMENRSRPVSARTPPML